jgi:DNA-binding Lrp family transcriptional regulator
MAELDALDLALIGALRDNPRAGVLQLSRLTRVARATVQSRLDRMERDGVITGYGPDIDVAAAGFGVLAFVTLEITQGALDRVREDLAAIPGVLEAYAITGAGDVLCQVAATAHRQFPVGGPLHVHDRAVDGDQAPGSSAAERAPSRPDEPLPRLPLRS